MNVRRKAREGALQILYRMDISERLSEPNSDVEAAGVEMEGLGPGTEARRYCESLIRGVAGNLKEIDSTIEANSENWTVDRMAVVDRNILRIAVFELRFSTDIPYKVAMDEAVELAKRFGSAESGAFINGIIDRIHRSPEPASGLKKAQV